MAKALLRQFLGNDAPIPKLESVFALNDPMMLLGKMMPHDEHERSVEVLKCASCDRVYILEDVNGHAMSLKDAEEKLWI
jgi:hypothetical protein